MIIIGYHVIILLLYAVRNIQGKAVNALVSF